ncbi:hypothetical protein [Sporomusa sp. KB1]|jgi:hypothetical protein|uniref:hypothetical protein n=1 Tax=Sporomusa sp. KB1 TaxID=943346 RepID=UPI0016472D5B|nr:hypothetical protein [Sporomusa sp. KB1]
MTEKKKSLFEDAAEMMDIFRSLPAMEKAIAIAYVMGCVGQPLDTLIRSPKKPEQGPAA